MHYANALIRSLRDLHRCLSYAFNRIYRAYCNSLAILLVKAVDGLRRVPAVNNCVLRLFVFNRDRTIYCGVHQQQELLDCLCSITTLEEPSLIAHRHSAPLGFKSSVAAPSKYLYKMRMASVSSYNGLIHIGSARHLTETVIGRKSAAGFVKLPLPVFEFAETCYVAAEKNFYHFVTEDLVNISYCCDAGESFAVLVPGEHNWRHEFLALLFPHIRVVRTPVFCRVRAPITLAVTKNWNDSYVSTASLLKLRALLRTAADRVTENAYIGLYVSRRLASRRVAKNEVQFEEQMRSLGLQPVVMEELSVVEQIKKFSSARIVVGCHGAGLTLLPVCDDATNVFEMYDAGYRNFCYASIADRFGMPYYWCEYKERLPIGGEFVDGISLAVEGLR